MTDRTCGPCIACCVWLDIKELRKPGGRPCKHLRGIKGSDHRCGIYSKRPAACSEFLCMWMQGAFPDSFRPSECGLLAVPYEVDDEILVTINITDESKCGTLETGPLSTMIHYFLGVDAIKPIKRVTILNRKRQKVLEFSEGEVWEGVLLKSTLEELVFQRKKKVADYMTADNEQDVPREIRERSLVLRAK